MAPTQYIGARYVPILADPVEWSSTKTYEPLTIVTHEGNSYTSRQFVPQGIDINNDAYWALTGNYNAQIEQYRQDTARAIDDTNDALETFDTLQRQVDTTLPMSAFENKTVKQTIDDIANILPQSAFTGTTVKKVIDSVEGKNVICIGDSYGEGYTPDGNVNPWINYFKAYVEQYDYKVYSRSLGGSGFWRDDSAKRFSTLIAALANTMSTDEKNNVSCIIIGGGYNDRKNTAQQINTGMQNARQEITSHFPNIKRVLIFPFGMSVQGLAADTHSDFQYEWIVNTLMNYVSANADVHLGTVVGNANMLLRRNTYFSSDYVHPNTSGQFLLGSFVSDVFFGNTNSLLTSRYNDNYTPNLALASGITMGAPFTINTIGENFIAHRSGMGTITLSNTPNLTFDSQHPLVLGTYADASIQRYGNILIPVYLVCRSTTSRPMRYNNITGYLQITNGVLSINGFVTNAQGTNFLTLESVDQIQYFVTSTVISGLRLV